MQTVPLAKIAGVSAILATVTLVPWFAFPLIAPAVGIEFPQSRELVDWAGFKVEHASIIRAIDWLVIVSLLFETITAVGFFYVLRRSAPLGRAGPLLSEASDRASRLFRRASRLAPRASPTSRDI